MMGFESILWLQKMVLHKGRGIPRQRERKNVGMPKRGRKAS